MHFPGMFCKSRDWAAGVGRAGGDGAAGAHGRGAAAARKGSRGITGPSSTALVTGLRGWGAQAGTALQVLMGAVLLLTGVMVATKVYMDRRVAVAARVAPPKAAPGGKRRGRCYPRCPPCLHSGRLRALGKHLCRASALSF